MTKSTKILLMCCLLSACGSKGDLYLPSSDSPEVVAPIEIHSPTPDKTKSNQQGQPSPSAESELPAL